MEYKIIVKDWMKNYETFMGENSFLVKNNTSPMPFSIMYGKKLEETERMIKMELYADVRDEYTKTCVKCGKTLTNEVSKYLGIGPECGGHNYTVPFEDEEKLNQARAEIKEKLNKIKWTGWILKAGIISLINLDDDGEELTNSNDTTFEIKIEVRKSEHCNGEYSLFISFPYDQKLVNIIREQIIRYWIPDKKEWELPLKSYNNIMKEFSNYKVNVVDLNDIVSNLGSERQP